MRGNGTSLNITDWQITITARLTEKTHSGSGGTAQSHKVLEEWSGSFNLPWDSDNIPDVDMPFDNGDEPTWRGYLGDSGKFYQGPIIVESCVAVVNNQNDIVRFTVNFKGNGTLVRPVT